MGPRHDTDLRVYAALTQSRTVFYTPSTTSTLRPTIWTAPRTLLVDGDRDLPVE
jgi:hypothetical protein